MAHASVATAAPSAGTGRLVLRPVESADAGATAELVTPALVHYLTSWASPMSLDEARARIVASRTAMHERRGVDFAILRGRDGALLGWIGLKAVDRAPGRVRLGFWLGEPYHGRGYMSEAAGPALRIGASWLGADAVEAGATFDNAASIAILRRLGMAPIPSVQVQIPSRRASVECLRFELRLQPALTSSRSS